MLILIFFSSSLKLSAYQNEWVEVSKTINELMLVDSKSINYDNRGFLSVIIKHSDVSPEDQNIISSDSYLMAIDCDNRLFSKLPVTGDIKQVKHWQNPINNKLIKKTIIKTCSF
tara:strand:+ start:1232 stop:1573 length:342 start_codon:yes stop_codon:yes gene_type:complete